MVFNKIRPQLSRYLRRAYYTVNSDKSKSKQDVVSKFIYTKIKATGPITISDYMKEVLVHPMGGYYMDKDVIGAGGDFITSPELNQIFGEMVAVWFLNEWSKIGSPKPIQIVELGPGRGSLMQDIIRVFKQFDALKEASIHLVEVSPLLSDLQSRRLCLSIENMDPNASECYKQGSGTYDTPIKWYKSFKDVPNGFKLIVANEFFDALPIHKFQKTERGYREILVDISADMELKFRYVLANDDTPASKLYLRHNENRPEVEFSPQSLVVIKEIATELESYGGLALIVDYGHLGEGTDTFRAYKNHKQQDPLIEPGTADLTADVDFSSLVKAATEEGKVIAFGPTSQRDFLVKMGVKERLLKLKENIDDDEQLKNLEGSLEMMIDPKEMGERFKFVSLFPAVLQDFLKKFPAAGFQ